MKNKKIIIGVSIMCIIVISITLILITNKSSSKVLNNNLDNTNIENKVPGMFAIMLETEAGSGQYQQSTSGLWPGSGYEFNSTLSQCENGGILTWNEEMRSVNLKSNLSDKCYLYFDIIPPDVTIYASNSGYGAAPATLNCNNVTAEYNQKYNRIEISQINRDYPQAQTYGSCNLTYQTPSSTTYLNNYIIDLSGTTQGTGQVVNETYEEPDYTSATILTESQYGNVSMYIGDSLNSTSGTTTDVFAFVDDNWSIDFSDMYFRGEYFNFSFSPEEPGYYQICYHIDTLNTSQGYVNLLAGANRINETDVFYDTLFAIEGDGCQNLGYISTTDFIYIVAINELRGSPIRNRGISFSIEKANIVNKVDTSYRYEGKNPNNYIWFNNELWRIIGVFDEATHGVSGQNLVKIIRVGSIGGLAWDKNGEDDWSQASLMNLLNGAYYNSENGTGGEYCYGGGPSIPANCDYTETGINDTYRSMIENVTWYLGLGTRSGIDMGSDAKNFYARERGYFLPNNITAIKTTTGYIGLMYPSDYGYSVLASSCNRTTSLGLYNIASCAGQSWLYGQEYEWTITPYALEGDEVIYVSNNGNADNSRDVRKNVFAVRPVLYLDSSVYVINGTGSISDPYIIGM